MSLIYTTLATDTFQRPDESPLNPTNWTIESGGEALAIVNQQCVANPLVNKTGWEYYSGISLPNNQWAEITIGAGNFAQISEIDLQIRDDGTGFNFYFLDLYQNVTALFKSVSGSVSMLASLHIMRASGDTWRLGAFGSSLYVFQNGVQVGSATDSDLTSGHASLSISFDSVQTDTSVAAFRIGSITQSGGGGGGTSGDWLTINMDNMLRGSRSH